VLGKRIRLVSHQNGQDVWEIESSFSEQRIISAEAQEKRLLIFSNSRAEVFDPSSGRSLWTFKAGDRIIKSVLFEKDTVFFHTRLKGESDVLDAITAAHTKDGTQIWTHDAGGAIRSPLLSYNGRLYYTNECGITALKLPAGKPAFRSIVPGDFNIDHTLGMQGIYLPNLIGINDKHQETSLPDLISVHGKHIVAIRETYGIAAIIPETGKIAFSHIVPLTLSQDYTFAVRRGVLKDKVLQFAKLRHEKNADKKIEKIDADSHYAADTFCSSFQHLASASASSPQFERLTRAEPAAGGRNVGGIVVGSREAVAIMGAQRAAIETRIVMDKMMANIQFWNSVTGTFFGAIEGAQAAMQQANLSKAQLELDHAQTLHWQSLQHGFYVRPYKLETPKGGFVTTYANGVTLVDLDSGARSDFLFGVIDNDLTSHGLEFPTFAVSEDGEFIITNAIGLDSSRYEKYELGRYDMPYPFILAFSVSSLSFKKGDSIANPDLVRAVSLGKFDLVRKLIAADPQRATLKKYGGEALIEAIRWGHGDVARFLVDRGSDVNADVKCKTPLVAAAEHGDKELVQYLIRKGADVNGGSCSCLLAAISYGHLEIARVLIAAGADVNQPTYFKPLAVAKRNKESCKTPCDKPYDEIITLLVKSGAQGVEKNLGPEDPALVILRGHWFC
jgi:hypothetical protein